MIICLISLFALTLFPSAQGIAFPTPLPTITQHASSEPPQPTMGAQLRPRAFKDAYTEEPLDGLLENPFRGGWYDTEVYATESDFYCTGSSVALFHESNSAFPGLPGMMGCCAGRDCDFATACVNRDAVDETPSLLSTRSPFIKYCNTGIATECATLIWPDSSFYYMSCATYASTRSIYTAVETYDSYASVGRSVSIEFTTVNDETVSEYSRTRLLSWGSSSSTEASTSQSTTATSSAEPTAHGSEKSSSSTSAGAIAGGVVGGLAGGAAIAAAGIFFFLQRKKKLRQGSVPSEELQENAYQAVPQNRSQHSSWLMPHVAEPEATYKPETSEPSTTGATPEPYSQDPPAELPDRRYR
ncbi:unnamed protein product [Penicillium bialowiezense]